MSEKRLFNIEHSSDESLIYTTTFLREGTSTPFSVSSTNVSAWNDGKTVDMSASVIDNSKTSFSGNVVNFGFNEGLAPDCYLIIVQAVMVSGEKASIWGTLTIKDPIYK